MLKHAEAKVWCAFTGDWLLVPKQHGMMFCFFTSKMDQRWDRHPTANCYQLRRSPVGFSAARECGRALFSSWASRDLDTMRTL